MGMWSILYIFLPNAEKGSEKRDIRLIAISNLTKMLLNLAPPLNHRWLEFVTVNIS